MSENYYDIPPQKSEEDKLYELKKEIIKKFIHGEEKYRNSPLFHNMVNSIIHGGDIYKIVDNLISIIESQQKELIELKQKLPIYHFIENKSEEDNN